MTIRRRILVSVGAAALAAGGVLAFAAPASAATLTGGGCVSVAVWDSTTVSDTNGGCYNSRAVEERFNSSNGTYTYFRGSWVVVNKTSSAIGSGGYFTHAGSDHKPTSSSGYTTVWA